MTSDLAAPEIAANDLTGGRNVAEFERLLVFREVAIEDLLGWPRRVDEDDVDRAANGLGSSGARLRPAVKFHMPRPSVSRLVTRMTGPFTC